MRATRCLTAFTTTATSTAAANTVTAATTSPLPSNERLPSLVSLAVVRPVAPFDPVTPHEAAASINLRRSLRSPKPIRPLTPHSFADGLSALHTASDFGALRLLLQSLCCALRWRHFSYRGHFPALDGTLVTPRLDNLPPSWQRHYDAQSYEAVDPVLLLACRQLTPVEWTRALYVSAQARQLLREQRAAGLRFGVTYPVFTPSGASGTLSLSSTQRPPSDSRSVGTQRYRRSPHASMTPAWMQHAGAALATHVHEAVWRIVQRDVMRHNAPALTPRERECLQWVARGKTSWEIGRILTISEHGVVFHLRGVMRKFGVSSRHRAAKLASDYGLLDDIIDGQRDPRASCSASA